jgi:uncharacterized protein YndB with AHSA1/START domain
LELQNERKNQMTTIDNELIITRVFNAPRKLLWKAWTEPKHFKRWWGPKDFTSPVCKIDFRVGGKYLACMRSPEGRDFWSTGVYREIVPLQRIVCSDNFADEKSNVVPASYYRMPGDNWPMELTVTITFEDPSGLPGSKTSKTKMTLRHVGFPVGQMSDMAKTGWNESFDKLAESLK